MDKKLELILRASNEFKASDIHLTAGVQPIFRIRGDLKRYGKDILTPDVIETIAKSIIAEKMWDSFLEKGELDFSCGLPGVSRFRVNVYKQRSNIALAFRVIPTEVPSLESLELPPVLKKMMEKPQGLILVTGPTGSGKSSTLAAMINYINETKSKHILTLEDPIEYLHKHNKCIVDQREIGFDTHNFANGLRAALRQDPDIILVGEMRDYETIHTAITAAETGHLVLGTLHTSSAPSTVDRIIDVFPAEQQPQIRVQLASVLVSVISQRLFPTADGKGRRAATEILVNTSAVGNLIRSEKNHQIYNVMQTGRAHGMHTLESNVLELMNDGVISKEVAQPFLRELAE